ncbi:hypothetical protein H311_03616, partial [Anncaliia algerae PRA109]
MKKLFYLYILTVLASSGKKKLFSHNFTKKEKKEPISLKKIEMQSIPEEEEEKILQETHKQFSLSLDDLFYDNIENNERKGDFKITQNDNIESFEKVHEMTDNTSSSKFEQDKDLEIIDPKSKNYKIIDDIVVESTLCTDTDSKNTLAEENSDKPTSISERPYEEEPMDIFYYIPPRFVYEKTLESDNRAKGYSEINEHEIPSDIEGNNSTIHMSQEKEIGNSSFDNISKEERRNEYLQQNNDEMNVSKENDHEVIINDLSSFKLKFLIQMLIDMIDEEIEKTINVFKNIFPLNNEDNDILNENYDPNADENEKEISQEEISKNTHSYNTPVEIVDQTTELSNCYPLNIGEDCTNICENDQQIENAINLQKNQSDDNLESFKLQSIKQKKYLLNFNEDDLLKIAFHNYNSNNLNETNDIEKGLESIMDEPLLDFNTNKNEKGFDYNPDKANNIGSNEYPDTSVENTEIFSNTENDQI